MTMRSESSEHVRKTTDFFTNSRKIKKALESFFEKYAQEVGSWDRNWMNTEMQNADCVCAHVRSKIDHDDSENVS